MNKLSRSIQAITKSPLLWGVLGSAGFYALIHAGPLDVPFIKRYFAHHPVEYMETVMFSIGLAALLIKAFDTVAQRAGLSDVVVRLGAANGQSGRGVRRAAGPAGSLARPAPRRILRRPAAGGVGARPPPRLGRHAGRRIEISLRSGRRAAHAGYGQFRVIVWAIPILGFLGTVIGITMALNSVDLQRPDQSMLQVLNGLGLKFDTTALALTLSMVLMFAHFYVEHGENSLLEQVDRRVQQELAGRFAVVPASGDGQLVAMRRVAEMMLQNSEVLLRRQAELWQAAVNSAAQHWAQMSAEASENVKAAMSAAAGELTERAAVLERAVAAAGEVTRLEDALNGNLAALAGAKHFEQTVLSLAAAVNMLSARLAETTSAAAPIRLEPMRRTAHAA